MRRGRLHLLEVGVHWPPERFLGRKLEGLAARGVRVTVAPNRVFDGSVRLDGVELVSAPRRVTARFLVREALAVLVASPRRLFRLLRNVRQAPAGLRRRHGSRLQLLAMYLPLARLRPDVVQFEWNVAAVDHLPLFDVWGAPVATSCRGSDITVYPHVPTLDYYAARLPDVLREASAVHCTSESLRRDAVELGLDPAKARVIPPAVDAALFRPAPRNGGRELFRVLSVGGLRWEKGHEYALQAVRRLVDGGVPVRFELLGGVPGEGGTRLDERECILHAVADLELEDHVLLAGEASPAEVGRRLGEADALLHASVADGIPNVVLEAMACEVPVVTTNAGGVTEAVRDGAEGFVVPPREPERLASALLVLWRDPTLAGRMGRAGRLRVRSSFSPESQIKQFLEMYREVA